MWINLLHKASKQFPQIVFIYINIFKKIVQFRSTSCINGTQSDTKQDYRKHQFKFSFLFGPKRINFSLLT